MDKEAMNKLMEIKKLYESGILTKEEMEAEKAKILSPAITQCIKTNDNNSKSDLSNDRVTTSESKPSDKNKCEIQNVTAALAPTHQTVKTSKDFEKGSCTVYKYNLLLWWAIIYVVAGIITTLIWNMISSYGFWNVSLVYRKIYYILLIICHISNVLPTLAIKNKTYKTPCIIGVGLLSLYYIYQTIQNMMQY